MIYAWSFVVFRAVLALSFLRADSWIAWFFGASEMFCVLMSIWGLCVGVVDSSRSGRWVPLLYLAPLAISVAPPIGPAWAGLVVVFGCFIQAGLRVSMGRCVSVGVPVYQGVLSRGAYALVRHPLALCESLVIVSMWIYWPNAINAVVAPLAIGAIVLAVVFEEKFLRGFPRYRDYSQIVRFRLIPGIW